MFRSVFRFVIQDIRADRFRYGLIVLTMGVSFASVIGLWMARQAYLDAITTKSRMVLGGDLVVISRQSPPESFLTEIRERHLRPVQLVETLTVARMGEQGPFRTILLRGVERGFPLYGGVETTPQNRWDQIFEGDKVVVEASLKIQFGLKEGDRIKIGGRSFYIVGFFRHITGEPDVAGVFAPRVFMNLGALKSLNLLQKGSLYRTRLFFKFTRPEHAEAYRRLWRQRYAQDGLQFQTPETYRRRLGRQIDRVMNFLALMAIGAVLLGGVGVLTAVSEMIRRRRNTYAILRCMGVKRRVMGFILFVQISFLSLMASLLGLGLGWFLTRGLLVLFGRFLPVEPHLVLTLHLVLPVLVMVYGIGTIFTIVPIVQFGRVAPLSVLRRDNTNHHISRWSVFLTLAILWSGCGYGLYRLMGDPRFGILAMGFLSGVCLLLFAGYSLTLFILRRLNRRIRSFSIRYGILELVRFPLKTSIYVISIGLAIFILVTLSGIEQMVVDSLTVSLSRGDPNLVLIDVQPDQVEAVLTKLEQLNLSVPYAVPLVSMRIHAINNTPINELLEKVPRRSRWALVREYRSTYRDRLVETENLIQGEWIEHSPSEGPVPVSIEVEIARRLGVGLGDRITFNVQGVLIDTRISSIRNVNWQAIRPNFFFVFPAGVLEDAPQTWMIMVRTESPVETAKVFRAISKQYPNISMIDVTDVIENIKTVVRLLTQGLSLLIAMILLTGVILMIVLTHLERLGREYRMAILRALGAGSRQIRKLILTSVALTASLATGLGWGAGHVARYLLSVHLFELDPLLMDWRTSGVVFVCWGIMILIGWFLNREIIRRPPHEVLTGIME